MATWASVEIPINGKLVKAQAPLIISASRSTDIPAFYSDWFFHRIKVGYSAWTNPFNGVKSYISYENTRFVVFWSKNPRPLLVHLDELKKRGIKCYVQYSLNDYEEEKLECGVPPLVERIETFKKLVDELGFGGVVWRFDPLMLTDCIDIDKLIDKIGRIGEQLKDYTEKLVFSFADINIYRKVKHNLIANGITYHEWEETEMIEFVEKLVSLNNDNHWNLKLATCGEKGCYPGVEPNHCVDDELIIRRAYEDKVLMDFLKADVKPIPSKDLFGNEPPLPPDAIILGNGYYATRGDNRDKGQRGFCGCMKSKDIGQYNTCVHLCEYCYANTNKQTAIHNYQSHKRNPWGETITGQ